MTAVTAPAPSMFAVFRRRDFSLLWTAQLVSTAGSALTDLAAGIYVWRVTESTLAVALTLMVTVLPSLVVGLLALAALAIAAVRPTWRLPAVAFALLAIPGNVDDLLPQMVLDPHDITDILAPIVTSIDLLIAWAVLLTLRERRDPGPLGRRIVALAAILALPEAVEPVQYGYDRYERERRFRERQAYRRREFRRRQAARRYYNRY